MTFHFTGNYRAARSTLTSTCAHCASNRQDLLQAGYHKDACREVREAFVGGSVYERFATPLEQRIEFFNKNYVSFVDLCTRGREMPVRQAGIAIKSAAGVIESGVERGPWTENCIHSELLEEPASEIKSKKDRSAVWRTVESSVHRGQAQCEVRPNRRRYIGQKQRGKEVVEIFFMQGPAFMNCRIRMRQERPHGC